MRILITKDTPTVGRFYTAGELAEVQDPLALALIEMGAAELPVQNLPAGFPKPEPLVAPAPEPEPVVEVEAEAQDEEPEEPEPEKPRPSAKKK